MGMHTRAGTTLKVRNALSMLDMEDRAVDVVHALGVRSLVVVNRTDLLNEKWLAERIAVLKIAADGRSVARRQRRR